MISAWYAAAYNKINQEVADEPLCLSFPWTIHDHLCQMKKEATGETSNTSDDYYLDFIGKKLSQLVDKSTTGQPFFLNLVHDHVYFEQTQNKISLFFSENYPNNQVASYLTTNDAVHGEQFLSLIKYLSREDHRSAKVLQALANDLLDVLHRIALKF
jgi:hypothetical protein